jgi:hypothetical protein
MPTGSARAKLTAICIGKDGGRLQSSKKPVVPNHGLDVRYWHLADILLAKLNVC